MIHKVVSGAIIVGGITLVVYGITHGTGGYLISGLLLCIIGTGWYLKSKL